VGHERRPELGFCQGPTPATKLGGEPFRTKVADQLVLCRFSSHLRDSLGFGIGIFLLEALDERSSFIAGEPSRSLTLSEAHRATGISEVSVTSLLLAYWSHRAPLSWRPRRSGERRSCLRRPRVGSGGERG
jgi:hypothetical protein